MTINTVRHVEIFSPDLFGKKRVDVIGVGATGSNVTMQLAKLGIKNIHIWDYDKVASHNIANQLFGLDHIERLKVEALAEIISALTDTKIETHKEAVDGSQELGDVVFLLTDTMESRKEIFEKGLEYNPSTQLMIETRMGTDDGRVYTINPSLSTHVDEWKKTLYSDEESATSVCGTSITVGPTAELLAGLAVWQLIRWFNIENGESNDEITNEILFGLRPPVFMNRNF